MWIQVHSGHESITVNNISFGSESKDGFEKEIRSISGASPWNIVCVCSLLCPVSTSRPHRIEQKSRPGKARLQNKLTQSFSSTQIFLLDTVFKTFLAYARSL
mmetsp:Transcript_28767/g.60247  ORF Transcript_28767/g.60247 Transcript_28767/m.60247 type:complete len:102 (-) Transcript_28767:16-321(-)